MSDLLSVGILGATGAVGQKLITLLSGHPWFRVTALCGSARSQGRPYGETVHWLEGSPLPLWAEGMTVSEPSPDLGCDVVFSALEAEAARQVEPRFVSAGCPVVSNARISRMESAVPLLVPEVNPDHLEILRGRERGVGFVVTNPNCSTTGLVLGLKPLLEAVGIRRVSVTTLQAMSGAGYPGVPGMDILGNVIPWIPGEAQKLESEPLKILGTRCGVEILQADIAISAQANRVPVLDGHLLSVSVEPDSPVGPEEAVGLWQGFRSPLQGLGLPSAPESPVQVSLDPGFPQPRLHGNRAGGMVVWIGQVRACPVLGLRFVVLVHNTVRGAAGGAILNAEVLRKEGFLGTPRPALAGTGIGGEL